MNKIVGIDLTGSEKRASGIATLWDNGQVQTTRLKTDDEIITEVLVARPDLVSIDSPLSLPEDPTKIYRECELVLKRRGIGVYWCLLPSMEKLTRRGIGLAGLLRTYGHRVIESYPGAAQDILGIPRKNKGIKVLAEGLAAYGIKGDLSVSHDELDAITAAIVGQLYMEGKYEALGCLIIPKISVGGNMTGDDVQTVALGRLKDYLESAAELLDKKRPDWDHVQRTLGGFLKVQMEVFPASIKRLEMARIADLVNVALAEAELEDRIRDVAWIKERVNLARQKFEKLTSV